MPGKVLSPLAAARRPLVLVVDGVVVSFMLSVLCDFNGIDFVHFDPVDSRLLSSSRRVGDFDWDESSIRGEY